MLKNGEAPICMRISVNCQAVDISINRSVAVDSWNQTRECCTSTHPHVLLNLIIIASVVEHPQALGATSLINPILL